MFFTRMLPYFEDLFGDDTFKICNDNNVCEADCINCEASFDEVKVLYFNDQFDDEFLISISGGIERQKQSLFCVFFDIFLI